MQTEPRASRVSLGWRCQPESHSSRPPAGNGVSAAARGDPNVTAANRLIPKFYSMLVAGLEGCFASSCLLKQRSYPGGAQTWVGIQLRAPSLGTSQEVPQTQYPVYPPPSPPHLPCRKAPPWGPPPAHPQSSPTTSGTPAHRLATVATVPRGRSAATATRPSPLPAAASGHCRRWLPGASVEPDSPRSKMAAPMLP